MNTPYQSEEEVRDAETLIQELELNQRELASVLAHARQNHNRLTREFYAHNQAEKAS